MAIGGTWTYNGSTFAATITGLDTSYNNYPRGVSINFFSDSNYYNQIIGSSTTEIPNGYSSRTIYFDWQMFSPSLSGYSKVYAKCGITYYTGSSVFDIGGTVYLYSPFNIIVGTSGTFSTSPSAPTRPSYYYWTYAKQSGGAFNLTASEWNGLMANINAVRSYKGYSSYSYNYAYSGNSFYAYMYNQAVYAIQGISGYGSYLSTVSSGATISAYQMNVLISELNAIP